MNKNHIEKIIEMLNDAEFKCDIRKMFQYCDAYTQLFNMNKTMGQEEILVPSKKEIDLPKPAIKKKVK